MGSVCERESTKLNVLGIISKTFNTTNNWSCSLVFVNFAIFSAGIFCFLLLALFKYYRTKRSCFNIEMFKRLSSSIRNSINNSMAAYLSDSPLGRSLFYFYGNFIFIFGYPLSNYCKRALQALDNDNEPRLVESSLLVLVIQIFFTFLCNISFMQLFLMTMIGGKLELLQSASHPMKALTLSLKQRKVFVRSSIIRTLNTTFILFSLPDIIKYILGKQGSNIVAYLLSTFLFFYYAFERVSYLSFEKEALKIQAAYGTLLLKYHGVSRFLEESSPLVAVRAMLNNKIIIQNREKFEKELKEVVSSKLDILNEQLALIENDKSVPLPINTGEIPILSKIVVLMNFTLLISYLAMILSEISFLTDFANELYFWGVMVFIFCVYFFYPLIAVPLFSSHMMFGSKSESNQIKPHDLEREELDESLGYQLLTNDGHKSSDLGL